MYCSVINHLDDFKNKLYERAFNYMLTGENSQKAFDILFQNAYFLLTK